MMPRMPGRWTGSSILCEVSCQRARLSTFFAVAHLFARGGEKAGSQFFSKKGLQAFKAREGVDTNPYS